MMEMTTMIRAPITNRSRNPCPHPNPNSNPNSQPNAYQDMTLFTVDDLKELSAKAGLNMLNRRKLIIAVGKL